MSGNEGAPKPKKRRALVRPRKIPSDAASRVELIRALTRTTRRIETHVRAGENWRNRRQLDAFRNALDERGKILEQLQADTPTVWATLVAELDLEVPNVQKE